MQLAVLGKAFDGRDLRAGRSADRKRARLRRHAIDMDCAGTALGDAATVLGSGHPDPFSDDPQQWSIRVDINFLWFSIDCEADHSAPPWSRCPAQIGYDDSAPFTRSG